MRATLLLLTAAASLAAHADFLFPSVPVAGSILAEFTLTTTSGAPLSGIPVSLTVPDSCGQVSPSQVTTDGSGKGRFTFVAGSRTGVCTVAGSSGGTTVLGRTTVFRPAEIVIEGALSQRHFVGSEPNDFLLKVKAGGLPLGLLPLAVGGQFSPSGPTVPAGAQQATTDASGAVRVRTTGATQPGIYDLPVTVAGVVRHLRLRQYVIDFSDDSWKQRSQGDPWNRVIVTLPDRPAAPCGTGGVVQSVIPTLGFRPAGIVEWFGGMFDVYSGCPAPLRVRMEYPDPIPADGQVWVYNFNETDLWYFKRLPAEISGNSVTFTVSDFRAYSPPTVMTTVGIGLPGTSPALPPQRVQGMWWGGTGQDGWGVSIVQSRDYPIAAFAALYAYDSAGEPTWWVMPTGGWQTSRGQVFTTSAYSPVGTPWHNFESLLTVVGDPAGRVQMRFADANTATMEYTLNGLPGSKTIRRLAFGGAASAARPEVAGMWWGGEAQNGWGIAILQEGDALFNVWYTYDAANKPTWFVMSGGRWSGAGTYEGRIYRARGSPWLTGAYDASRFQLSDVGEYRATFNGPNATFAYTLEGRTGTLLLSRTAPY